MSRITRRLAFAAPLVVTFSCDRPVEHRPRPRRHVEPRIVEPTETEARAEEPPPDVAPRVPDELVEAFVPLTNERTVEQYCRRVRCDPSRPYPAVDLPEPVVAEVKAVSAIQREGSGSRVRIPRGERMDGSWRAVFIEGDGTEHGDCTIVDWDYTRLDCTTPLAPEQLIDGVRTFKLRLIPPPALVARVERERARWMRETENPPRPRRVRVIGTEAGPRA